MDRRELKHELLKDESGKMHSGLVVRRDKSLNTCELLKDVSGKIHSGCPGLI